MDIQGKEIASDFWDKEILIGDSPITDKSFLRITVGTKGDVQKISMRTFRYSGNDVTPTRKGMTFFTNNVADVRQAMEYIEQNLTKP